MMPLRTATVVAALAAAACSSTAPQETMAGAVNLDAAVAQIKAALLGR